MEAPGARVKAAHSSARLLRTPAKLQHADDAPPTTPRSVKERATGTRVDIRVDIRETVRRAARRADMARTAAQPRPPRPHESRGRVWRVRRPPILLASLAPAKKTDLACTVRLEPRF